MNRDLDATIAEEIFGWKETHVGPDYYGENECEILTQNGQLPEGFVLPPKGKLHRAYLCPSYTFRMDEAMRLVKFVKLDVPAYALPSEPAKIAEMCLAHWRVFKKGKS